MSISASTSLRTSLGNLALANQHLTRQQVSNSYSLSVAYPIRDDLEVSVDASATKFLTHTSGACGDGDGRPMNSYDFCWNNPSVNLSYSGLAIDPADLSFSFGSSYTIPLIRSSRFMHLRGTLGLSAGASWSHGIVSVGYDFGYSHTFVPGNLLAVDPNDVEGTHTFRDDQYTSDGQVITDHQFGGVDSIDNSLSLSLKWFKTGLSSSFSLGFSDAWDSNGATADKVDEFTPEGSIDSLGRGHDQSYNAALGTRYSFLGHYGVGLRLSYGASPLTDDQKSTNLPFIDTTENLSRTSVSASFSYNY